MAMSSLFTDTAGNMPFHIMCIIHFSSPITVYFKSRTFSLPLSRESHAEIKSRRFFSLVWKPNIKAIINNMTKFVQMIFSS